MNSRRTSPSEATRSAPCRAVPCRADPRDALPADVISEMSTLKPNLPYSLIGPVNSGVRVFHAGTKREGDDYYTSSGRVLGGPASSESVDGDVYSADEACGRVA